VELCPPPDEDSPGPSNFIANGPCGFQQRGAVGCEAAPDDFYVALTRKAKQGATLVVYLNVENYRGPGSYGGAQMFVTVQGGTAIHRWSSDVVHATVAPGGAFVTIPPKRLEGEPALYECTQLLGPKTNYQYQCGVRSMEIDRTVEVVSGVLQCAESPKKVAY
jgi:hypothetical protein